MPKKPREIKYPIEPRHIDTTVEPQGFGVMLGYNEMVLLWGYMEFCQHKGNWDSFTFNEFQTFIDDERTKIHAPLRTGVLVFGGPMLSGLFNEMRTHEGGPVELVPTRLVIVTYFLWNPAKNLARSGLMKP